MANRAYRIFKTLGTIIIIPIGISETILNFSPVEVPMQHRPLILITLIAGSISIYLLTRSKARLITNIPVGSSYKILFPCGDKEFSAANNLARRAFGKRNSISKETIDDWRSKNKLLLSILVDSNFKLRGYFDLIPITEDFYKGFSQGEMTEKDINSKVILGENEIPEYVYIGGITSSDDNPIVGSVLITALILKIKYLYGYKDIVLTATAATEDGEHYLNSKEFKFQLIKGKDFRKDGQNFYEKRLTPLTVDKFLKDLGRKSKFLDYSDYKNYTRSEVNTTESSIMIIPNG